MFNKKAFVLLTALPFTKGHESLIQFAKGIQGVTHVRVILALKDGEPLQAERKQAISNYVQKASSYSVHVSLDVIFNTHDEDPNSKGFWDYWRQVFLNSGYIFGDYIVGSEPYINTIAQTLWATPMPFDIKRTITDTKATRIRNNLEAYYKDLSPYMTEVLRKTYTIFGAESVGKTTTMQKLQQFSSFSIGVTEFARPYLEMVGADLTPAKMMDIVAGQVGQDVAVRHNQSALIVWKDTDLYSTIGYFRLHPELDINSSFKVNLGLLAKAHKSDHYFILSSDLPFEEDALRYGGTVRESSDQFWIDLCEEFDLPYTYITETDLLVRCADIYQHASKFIKPLTRYTRKFND